MRSINLILFATFLLLVSCQNSQLPGPFFATGIKIGEVTDASAIIWTRLTQNPQRVGSDAPMPKILYKGPESEELKETIKGRRADHTPVVQYADGFSIENIEGACPGMVGDVRLLYKKSNDSNWLETEWRAVDPNADFTQQLQLTGLTPNTAYLIRVESRHSGSKNQSDFIEGKLKTAPATTNSEKVIFTVTTGTAYPDRDLGDDGYKIYPQMLKLNPSFFVHTGDILYYDRMAKTKELALLHWDRMYSLPTNIEFHKNVPSYFIKDDHDFWMNDAWPGMETKYMGEFTWQQGLEIFPQEVPMSKSTYRTFRWGKDLQVWLVEGRDFRSPNTMPDGPEKTIWGKEQKGWFYKTVSESDATFKILISPTPVVGPDRKNKRDNHSNKVFATEGNEIRRFISKQKNMWVVCGDRHWQYVSEDQKTKVQEYSCGPASNEHAGGWSNDMLRPQHKYLNVTGGFLAVTVDMVDGAPSCSFTHYSVEGEILNKEVHK
jgi:alkaline phosphatase D